MTDNTLSHLGFQRFEPSKSLSHIVECYWFINSDHPIVLDEYLHPSGGMGLILNYGDALQFEGVSKNEMCILDGTNTVSRKLGFQGLLHAVGIRFNPAGASLLFSLPLNELKNETVSLTDTRLKGTEELYNKLSNAKTFPTKVSIIEDWLHHYLHKGKQISNRVLAPLSLIKVNKGDSFTLIAQELAYYDQAHFSHQFKKIVGIAPREYFLKKNK